MMKSSIIFVVLSALAACHGAAVAPSEDNMISRFALEQMYPDFTVEYNEKDAAQNRVAFFKGEAKNEELLLLRREMYMPAVPNTAQNAELVHRSASNIRITGVMWSYLSWPPPAHVSVDGLGTNVVQLRYTSFVGESIHVIVNIYGQVIQK